MALLPRYPANPTTQTAAAPAPVAPPRHGLTGLTLEQARRLAALRERVRRGAYRDDGAGSLTGDPAFDRRLAFARWLVQHGRLGEFDLREHGEGGEAVREA